MESLQQTAVASEDQTAVLKPEPTAAITAVSARLWSYGGSRGKLRDVNLEPEGPIAALLSSLVQENDGKVVGTRQSILVAHFESPLRALSLAKLLQQKLLALPQDPAAEHFAAAMVVHGWGSEEASGSTTSSRETLVPKRRLIEANVGRILVTAGIHNWARGLAQFQFSEKPVPRADGGGASESLYELFWTDQSTYDSLRKAVQSVGTKMPKLTRYELLSELGRGSMGVVYKATDKLIGRMVALKTISISTNATDQEELVERLKQEAKAAGSLDHPNIITIFDVGQEHDLVYLSMQFVEGTTLAELLTEGRLPPVAALLTYADQICGAVGFAHQKGVIHRDLKPANLMLTQQGTIKILDFGIAKLGDVTLTQSGLVVGTPTHMSPEQAMGRKLDQRSDIFSLGAVFYELFTRERPFKGDISAIFYKIIHEDPAPPAVINPSLPGGIDAIIRKALAKDPKQRFQTCEEMRDAFLEQAATLATNSGSYVPAARSQALPALPMAKPPSRPGTGAYKPPLPAPPRRFPWVTLLLFLILAVVSGILVLQIRPDWRALVIARWHSFNGTVPNQANTGNDNLHNDSSATAPGTVVPGSGAPALATGSGGSASTLVAQTSTGSAADPGTSTAASTGSAATSSTGLSATEGSGTTTGTSNTSAGSGSTSAVTSKSPSSGTSEDNSAKNHTHVNRTPAADNAVLVDGVEYRRSDIPGLLVREKRYEASGDYSTAKYTCSIILKLDRRNADARAALANLTKRESGSN